MTRSKITKLEIKEPFKGKKSAFVGFEDKKWGFYEYDDEPLFKEGEVVDYQINLTTSENGKEVKLLTINRVTAQNTTASPPPTPQPTVSVTKAGRIGATMTTEARQRAEIDSAISCSNAVYDLIGQGKVDWAQFDEKCDVGYNWLLSNMDETYGAK